MKANELLVQLLSFLSCKRYVILHNDGTMNIKQDVIERLESDFLALTPDLNEQQVKAIADRLDATRWCIAPNQLAESVKRTHEVLTVIKQDLRKQEECKATLEHWCNVARELSSNTSVESTKEDTTMNTPIQRIARNSKGLLVRSSDTSMQVVLMGCQDNAECVNAAMMVLANMNYGDIVALHDALIAFGNESLACSRKYSASKQSIIACLPHLAEEMLELDTVRSRLQLNTHVRILLCAVGYYFDSSACDVDNTNNCFDTVAAMAVHDYVLLDEAPQLATHIGNTYEYMRKWASVEHLSSYHNGRWYDSILTDRLDLMPLYALRWSVNCEQYRMAQFAHDTFVKDCEDPEPFDFIDQVCGL